ncbi:MAG: hypothetical protein WCT99_04160 [Bacteroidota bacterium]|jgi:hypothetical protein
MKTIRIILILLSLAVPLPAQEQTSMQPKDTSLKLLRTEAIPLSLEQPIVILPLSFALSSAGEGTVQPLYYIFGESPEQFSWNREGKVDIASPWKIYLEEQKKNSTWRSVLGSVQLGGAAYIAYRHIKKYGLFK